MSLTAVKSQQNLIVPRCQFLVKSRWFCTFTKYVRLGSFATETYGANATHCPLCPQQRQNIAVPRLVAMGQKRTHAPQQLANFAHDPAA
jgi:hypothetical protein